MKKAVLLLIMCMSMLLFTACAGSADSDSTSSTASPNPGNVYRVITVDASGAPVPKVMVQFCSDRLCIMGETGEDGIAVFEDLEEGAYTAHIYSLPEGYTEDDTEYDLPETYGDITIVLSAAK